MKLRKEYLISYDVEDTKIRTKIFKEFERYGLRPVQHSVFWGFLTNAEHRSLCAFLRRFCDKRDKAFVASITLSDHSANFYIGHSRDDFRDWKEADVI